MSYWTIVFNWSQFNQLSQIIQLIEQVIAWNDADIVLLISGLCV